MKNLLTLLAIFLFTGMADAQNAKPTLEETVNYINDVVSVSLGKIVKIDGAYLNVTKQEFLKDKVFIEVKQYGDDNKPYDTRTYTYSKISWNSIEEIKIRDSETLKDIAITFKVPFLASETSAFKNEPIKVTEKSGIQFNIYIVPEKAENVKKALLRLKELTYKKDPFD